MPTSSLSDKERKLVEVLEGDAGATGDGAQGVVGDVHRARRHIENNIETVTFILVNLHILLLSHNLYF